MLRDKRHHHWAIKQKTEKRKESKKRKKMKKGGRSKLQKKTIKKQKRNRKETKKDKVRQEAKKLAQPKEQWRIHHSQQLTYCSHSLSTHSPANSLDALHPKWD